MDQLLAVIVQTSPIPSHPSTALLEALFRSFEKADGLLESQIVILCDGCEETLAGEKENNKHGKASSRTASSYRQHLELLQTAVETQQPPFVPQLNGSIQVVRLKERHGSARAIEAAFSSLTTHLCMVCQHDNFFVKEVPFRACVQQMHQTPGMGIGLKCLHFLSTATMDYQTKVQRRYNMYIKEIPAAWLDDKSKLVPLIFWYGRTHLSYTDHYRSTILNRPLQKGDHLEELLGVAQLEDIKSRGMKKAFPDYGTYVLDQGCGEVIYHLSGRRVRAASGESQSIQPSTATDTGREGANNSHDHSNAASSKPTDGSWTTARFCRAIVPGLEILAAGAQSPNSQPKGRFKQKCFLCGQKGHSKAFCPLQSDHPQTETIDLS
jgi:hypothetical protein